MFKKKNSQNYKLHHFNCLKFVSHTDSYKNNNKKYTHLQCESARGDETQFPPLLHGDGEQETNPGKKIK